MDVAVEECGKYCFIEIAPECGRSAVAVAMYGTVELHTSGAECCDGKFIESCCGWLGMHSTK